ncbi:FAD/NAD(P)-binding oxidoreductase [Gaiella sp.]|uniref:NAD(P)/FAD-dependent oxidoreductase n=1 Tax=Gaiella sp. TaxID=2663207 RepID=UPI002BC89A30|nr:FAD/NAD(P)-binding oxidoreductase [Gaiella sp.]HWO79692.1 FAD/NAD(P)-binding oxidoreductase [Gaiella sp.]
MTSYRYLIVGGGMTGDAACKGIRSIDPDGSIALVGDEPDPPYARPPLTKGLWLGKEESSIWRGTEDEGVDLHLGRTIVSLDLDAHTATDDRGDTYGYDRLLLATGGRPRHLPGAPEGVVHYRTLADYHTLRAAAAEGTRVAVIGGGFIGSELAAALASNGCAVTMIFPEEAIGTRLFPRELALSLNDYYREKGVELVAGGLVGGVERRDGGYRVTVDGGGAFDADVVVAGLGIVPRDELAADSGMATDNGIPVDDRGRVAGHDDVFAAGDVARFPARDLGRELRVEHEDHAKSHGRQVGRNMAGADEPYDHLPFFYSDLFELGYEAVGELDSRLETVAEWAEPHRKGVVCYQDAEGRPRGFLLWDVWGKVDAATDLIRAAAPVGNERLRELLG